MEKCPFCGSEDLDLQRGTKDREGFPVAVLCCDCGATGPWVYEKDASSVSAAEKAWNSRHQGDYMFPLDLERTER